MTIRDNLHSTAELFGLSFVVLCWTVVFVGLGG